MNINNTSSSSYPGSANFAAGAASRSSAQASVVETKTAPLPTQGGAPPPVAVDRVSISQEAQDRLSAETAEGVSPDAQTLQADRDATVAKAEVGPSSSHDAPSDVKKFTYGALGLERPTSGPEAAPKDSYSYGRWAAVAVTAGALLSALI
nr:hypothetical protein [uncultured Rhodoferax sp.]